MSWDQRAGRVFTVFLKSLPKQPVPYRAHEAWLDIRPEAVERWMLGIRQRAGRDADACNDHLRRADALPDRMLGGFRHKPLKI